MKKRSYNDLLLVLLLATVVVAITFPTILLHPNKTLMTIGGDGIKNYFTSLFYLQYNSGTHFTGMNYPFGEHISFSDAQPALVVWIKALCRLVPALAAYHLALFNLFLLAGMVAGVGFTYLLLRQLGALRLAAFTGAFCIAFFSPQLLRAESHYGLSYLFSFTGAWYLFLRAETKPSFGNTVLAVLFITICGLLHVYLAVLNALFLAGYSFLKTLTSLKNESPQLHLHRWSIAVVPVLLLQLFIRLTDEVPDRPEIPWGFLTALTHPLHLIIPLPSDLLRSTTTPYQLYEEGFAYAGASVLFVCLLTATAACFRKFWLPKQSLSVHFLISSWALLLLAMGIPFIFQLEWLADYTGPLRQFRGLGRFSWAYYYVAGVTTVLVLGYWWQLPGQGKQLPFRRIVIVVLMLLWMAEAGWRLYRISTWDQIAGRNYMLFMANNYGSLLRNNGVDPLRYQAILPLPYHHIGSEKFAIDHWPAPWYGMKLSLHTGLPGMQVMLSRTSYQQSTLLLQLTGDSLLQKELLPYLPNTKPLLLLTYNAALTKEEERLVQQARLLCSDGEIQLHELSLDAFENQKSRTSMLQLQEHTAATQKSIQKYPLPAGTTAFTHINFVQANKEQQPLLFDSTVTLFKAAETVHISLWLQPDLKKDVLPVLTAKVLNADAVLTRTDLPSKFTRDRYRDMIRISGTIKWPAGGNRLQLQLHTGSNYGSLLIRGNNDTIIEKLSERLVLINNIPVER